MLLAFVVPLLLAATPPSWEHDVEAALGRAGTELPGGVYKVSFPRSDLDVVAGGVHVKPALALGSWAAFVKTKQGVMAMGDLVLTEEEVNPVISALQAGGVEQTALHNHLLGETPRVLYVHFSGHGSAAAVAKTLRTALETTKTPLGPPSHPPQETPGFSVDQILGATGKAAGAVLQYSIPRRDAVREHGMVIPPAAGVATAINFQPTGNGRAATTGDFVLIGSEVNPVIRALRAGAISVTAIHSHMIGEQPRLFFMHFWGEGDVQSLARTLRRALDATARQ